MADRIHAPWAAALSLAVLATASAGAAQASPAPATTPVEPGEPPSAAPSARAGRARSLFQAGLAAARQGAWDDARRAFEESYALVPAPAILFNLAGAQRRSGRLLASHANYRRYAALSSDDAPDTLRQRAAQLADAVERVIPRLTLHIEGVRPHDRVVLDQQRIYADELGRDLWLDPGPHRLLVERAKADSETRTFTLTERETRVLSLRLP